MAMNDYQRFIHQSRYARWREELGRRETWTETVDRYVDFMRPRLKDDVKMAEIREAILNLEIMPSMRALMTAGKALERDNVAGFNCSYITIDNAVAFDEMMFILMCGTGCGFSVERQYVANLPAIPPELHESETQIKVKDSKMGWAQSFRELISLLYSGLVPNWDTSKVRPAGTRLKTMGGRASGPEPLIDLFNFTVALFRRAAGRKLTSLECHDLCCKIADIVVVGGVRRSALISLSNLSDDRMRNAKTGQWWVENGQRALANNSVAYTEKPEIGIFMQEWLTLYDSKSGERGIFNRQAAKIQAERTGRRNFTDFEFGTNPCGEILLRPKSFCNLTEVVVRPGDTKEELLRKVELATILGTLQSTLTNFRYLRKEWQRNCEEERLLGVSLTGIMDHPVLSGKMDMDLDNLLEEMRTHSVEVNKVWAGHLEINPSASITCVKPSGTASQLVDSASGIHARYSEYYIRRVRADRKDPLAQMLIKQGVPCEPDVTKPGSTLVFSFPIKSPSEAVFRNDRTAIEQLEIYLKYKKKWCEHNPSVTVYVKEPEWLEVGAWVYKNFNEIGGVSFLNHSGHIYKQAPYEEINRETYEKLFAEMPKVDWEQITEYEKYDQTEGARELACSAGGCDLV